MTLLSYIGPGAGIAAAGTLVVALVATTTMLVNFLVWPIRRVWRWIRLPKREKSTFRRVFVVGLDGLDPRRVERLMGQGQLPSMRTLSKSGGFYRLGSTIPPISPVAWSSFLTGVNPGKHGIFDFVARDRKTYLPRLSSAEVVTRRKGKRHTHQVKRLRKSEPFWKKLGEYGVPSTILRVPITFPPEPFDGTLLSAMCVPDLRGTQSSYTFLSTAIEEPDDSKSGGLWLPLEWKGDSWSADIPGPSLGNEETSMVLSLKRASECDKTYEVCLGKESVRVAEGALSSWISVTFIRERKKGVPGLTRAQIRRTGDDDVEVYLMPFQINPLKPVLPIGFPWVFSRYLARLIGPFATLGLAEDTSALSDGVIDHETFLRQAKDIHAEREEMAYELGRHRRTGLFTCVFDGPDRIQHMFFHEESDHSGSANIAPTTIDSMYVDLDKIVGRFSEIVKEEDLLLVISDHGFTSFRRGVDLNFWLEENGWLVWKDGATAEDAYEGIDWTRTKAYAFGLSGIYLNREGREKSGIVSASEAAALGDEISRGLKELRDPVDDANVVSEVYAASKSYSGPYATEGPDLIVGYEEGYRVSWDCASGIRGDQLYTTNQSAWCGDHCVDRSHVPGMMISNRRLSSEDKSGFELIDLAPSILHWFGIRPPSYMDGSTIQVSDAEEKSIA